MIEGLENVCKADSARSTKIDCTKTIEEYIQAQDWRIKANANTGYSNAGLINNISGKIIANYWLDKVYSKAEGDAHRNGDYYIHDLDCLAPYCCGHDLARLLAEGFNGVEGRVGSRPPKHLREALYQMANYVGILQAEWGGAQAFSSFDTYLAPYVFIDQHLNGLEYNDIKKAIRNFVYNLNVPSRWGQSPFSNCTIDYTVPRDLANQYPKYKEGYLFEAVYNGYTDKDSEDIKNFIKAIEDKLGEEICNEIKEDTNSEEEYRKELLQSLAYKHFEFEMRLIVKAFYETLNEGDEAGRPFTFPIPTVNITEDFDWDDENANLIFENAGKYGSSYFQNFIGSQYKRNPETGKLESDPDAYKPTDVRSMCCRLQLNKRELRRKGGGLFGADSQTGSIGVVTINMARLGYLYKGDVKTLYKKLNHLMELAKSTLEKKRIFVKEMLNRGLYPYTKRYLRTFDTFFSTIGVNGMNEMIRNFTNDEHDITDEYGQKFALEILTHIREKLKEFQESTDNLYNLEATPAEGCLSGNSWIWTESGNKKISELVGQQNIKVFSFNEATKEIELSDVESIFMTTEKAQVMKITFDNGREIISTLNHPFAKRVCEFGKGEHIEWINATNLKIGDRIKSVYLTEKDSGHVLAHNQKVHQIVGKYKFGVIPEGYVIHHINENKWDNSLDNLTMMTDADHRRLHLKNQQAKGHNLVGYGENNSFYGKKHSVKSKLQNSKAKAQYTEDEAILMEDAYVNGELSCAQISRMLNDKIHRTRVARFIRTRQSMGLITKNNPTCQYAQFNKVNVEYLKNKGFNKNEVVDILGGSSTTKAQIFDYYDFISTPNHKIVGIEYLTKEIPVYNMTVKDNHNYYVTDSEDAKDYVLTHNCTRRLAALDTEKYPDIITAGKDGMQPYYTNSSQLPVGYTDDVFQALDLQDELQTSYTGGTVLHLYMSEPITNVNVVKQLVKSVLSNYRLPYISVSPSYSSCPVHGYIPGHHKYCPKCDAELIKKYAICECVK